MKKLLQNATGQLKILPFHSNRAEIFCAIFFFSSLSTKKKHRKTKFCVGEMRFCGGGNWDLVGGGIHKILVGGGIPPIPPTRGNPVHNGVGQKLLWLEKIILIALPNLLEMQ